MKQVEFMIGNSSMANIATLNLAKNLLLHLTLSEKNFFREVL